MSALETLAARAGIIPEYHQIDGSLHKCTAETQASLLSAIGLPADDEGGAQAALGRFEEQEASGLLPRELVVTAGQESHHDLQAWEMTLENGEVLFADPDATWRLPPLPDGVHILREGRGTWLVIAAPTACPTLSALAGRERVWGITAPLYGLRSNRNLGLGDYEDLARAAEALAPTGAAFLGINPVHSRGIADQGISPYSPSSRTGFDTQHIALDQIAGTAHLLAPLLSKASAEIAQARACEFVAYHPARSILMQGLRAAFPGRQLLNDPDFSGWRAKRPNTQALEALFEALSLTHGPDWRSWPKDVQDPANPHVARFANSHPDEVLFHEWCQWLAATQLSNAQDRAKAAGMGLGLYLDIAVGVRPGGAETWANRDAFAVGASLGAPPDLLNAQGQNWALAPYSPLGLRAAHYRPFREMLKATMSRAGVARIDHVIGFARSFMVPDDGAPGGYVSFPLSTLLALTRIEAARAGCVVIGEDLGTVPDGLREAMAESHFLGCSITPFEREGDRLRHPAEYRPKSVASFGTHDLPSMAGWWCGEDITVRARVGQLPDEQVPAERAARERDKSSLSHLLAWENALPEGLSADDPPQHLSSNMRDGIHTILSCGATGMFAVSLDDMFLVTDQQNIPGTIDEEPNWQRKAPALVEDLANAPEVRKSAQAIKTR